MKIVALKDIAGGALMQNAEAAIEQVIRNMLDESTPYTGKRSVTIKMTFGLTSEDRDNASCEIGVTTKLAPVKPVRTQLNINGDIDTNEIYVEEYRGQIRGQMSFNDFERDKEDNSVIDYTKAKSLV